MKKMKAESPATAPPPAASSVKVGRNGAWWFVTAVVFVVGLGVGAGAAGWWFKGRAHLQYDTVKSELELGLHQSRADLEQARAQLNAVQARLTIEESTRKGLETTLQSTQAELGHARDQLAFFDQLFPPGPKGAVSIRALDIQRQGSRLFYKVLLMRNGANSEAFQGRLKFIASGIQDGKKAKVELKIAKYADAAINSAASPVAEVGAKVNADANAKVGNASDFALNFEQFQRSGGLLSVPDGFVPQTITVNVLEGDAIRATRSVNLPDEE